MIILFFVFVPRSLGDVCHGAKWQSKYLGNRFRKVSGREMQSAKPDGNLHPRSDFRPAGRGFSRRNARFPQKIDQPNPHRLLSHSRLRRSSDHEGSVGEMSPPYLTADLGFHLFPSSARVWITPHLRKTTTCFFRAIIDVGEHRRQRTHEVRDQCKPLIFRKTSGTSLKFVDCHERILLSRNACGEEFFKREKTRT